MSHGIKILFFLLAFLIVSPLARSQERGPVQILFVLDASGSMFGKWQGKLKMESAKKVLSHLVDSLDQLPGISMGLRVYGHQYPRDCKDTKLEVAFRLSNASAIKSSLQRLKPKGITPIAYSLEQAAYDFPKVSNAKNIIILITDGIEECGGDPCAVSRSLQQNKVVLKPFVIGLGIDPALVGKFKCLGKFYNTGSEESLKNIMNVVVSNVLDNTTVQVNLLDHTGAPTETNVLMSFSDMQTGTSWYNLEHTLNAQKQPDQFVIEATPTYSLKVHTIPPIRKNNIELEPGENNIINVKAPQGYLSIKMDGKMTYKDLKCLVYSKKTGELVNVQNINEKVKYLAGLYDIEVLTLPRTRIEGVKVTSKAEITKTVLDPGQLVVEYNGSQVGGIYKVDKGDLSLVYTVDPNVRGAYLYLQPGQYRFITRPTRSDKTIYTKTKDFYIKSSGVTKVNI